MTVLFRTTPPVGRTLIPDEHQMICLRSIHSNNRNASVECRKTAPLRYSERKKIDIRQLAMAQ